MKFYIAGPYGRRKGLNPLQCQVNVNKAVEVARRLIKQGHIPFIPHLYHYVHAGWNDTLDEDTWFDVCSAWIQDCDAIYMMKGYKESTGALRELEIAQSLSIPVYYEDMKDRY